MSTRRRTRKRECSSYELSTTKHPLNNSVINSPGRLRRPVPPLVPPFPSAYTPEVPRHLQEYERKELAALAAFIPCHFCSLSLSLSLFLSLTFSSLHSLADIHPTCIFFSPFFLSPAASRCYSDPRRTPRRPSSTHQPALTNYV